MDKLRAAAPPNFIWLDAVLDVVKSTRHPWHLPKVLDKMNEKISEEISEGRSNVESLYVYGRSRILELLPGIDIIYCVDILNIVALAYQPASLAELVDLVRLPEEMDLSVAVDSVLSMFLVLRDDRLLFRRPYARNLIRRNGRDFPSTTLWQVHVRMAVGCLRLVLEHLRCSRTQRTPQTAAQTRLRIRREILDQTLDGARRNGHSTGDGGKSPHPGPPTGVAGVAGFAGVIVRGPGTNDSAIAEVDSRHRCI